MKKKNNKTANAEAAANGRKTGSQETAVNVKTTDGSGSTEAWHGADESSMIREQERQARNKKKKKHRRKKQIAAIVVIALIVGGIWYAGWGRTLLAPEAEETVSISAGFGQEIIYAQLTAVRGNEITYTVARPADADNEDGTTQTSNNSGGQMSENAEVQIPEGAEAQLPDGMGGRMPEGDVGQMPEGMGGRMPEGEVGQMPEGDVGQMPEGMGGRMPEGEVGQMPEGMVGQVPEGDVGQIPGGVNGQTSDDVSSSQDGEQSQAQAALGRPERGQGGRRTQSDGATDTVQPQAEQSQNMSDTESSRNGDAAGLGGGNFTGRDFSGSGFSGGGFSGAGFAGAGMGGTVASADTGFTYDNVTYQLTDESVTTQIPVGTDVTTRLGTVTTFSRLAAGDRIALVVEEEDGQQIIMAVYIIG